jgi:hypothetical protein
MLIGLDIGFDELQRDQPDGMAQRLQLARPVMRAAACFHANQARRQVGEECHQLAALESLFKGSFSMRVGANLMPCQEAVAKRPLETCPSYQAASDLQEGFMDIGTPFIANTKAAIGV